MLLAMSQPSPRSEPPVTLRTEAQVGGFPTVIDLPRVRLLVVEGPDQGKSCDSDDEMILRIGTRDNNSLMLTDKSVSGYHFEISRSGAGWRLRDVGSTNGTFVNDRSAPAAVLTHGDRVQFGRNICKFLAGGHVESAYYEEIHRLVTTDGLTGLSNRRSFEEALGREFHRAQRYRRPLAVIMLDIDHFKRLNDTLGHLAGDAGLRQLGALIRANVRRDDTVGRLGGEEFAILLPEIDHAGAMRVADKIRELVRDAPFQYEGTHTPITVSAGVATLQEQDSAPLDLLVRADELLFTAKRAGRDQVRG